MTERFDIAVVGAGLAGLTAALALAHDGWSVVVINAGGPPASFADDDLPRARVSTLTPASINIFRRLEAWQHLPESRAQWFDTMRIWEDDPELELVFRAADAGLKTLGCVAENDALLGALRQAAGPRLTLIDQCVVADVHSSDRRARVQLDNGDHLDCALLVAADGARSPLRKMLDITGEPARYGQSGVVCTVQVDDHLQTAWQRFLPGGPLAFLPLPNRRCSIVWTCADEHAAQLVALGADDFVQQLGQASQQRFGHLEVLGKPIAFPLYRMHAKTYQAARAVLVGDAAHVVHPLAGQGANMGLLDAAALADVLRPLRGADPATPAALRQYARWRRSDNAIMAQSLHQIWRLYGHDTPTFRGLRLLGARFLGGMPWLRGQLVNHASGFGGQVPSLARPQPRVG